MNASVDDVKEFVAESREAALAMAESHFRTSADQLQSWVVPPSVHISGLGNRVLLIAALRSEGAARPQESRREERRAPSRDRDGDRRPARDRDRDRDRDQDRGRDRDRGGRSGSAARPAPAPRTPQAELASHSEESESPMAPGPLGEVGTFVAGVLERMKLRDVTLSESESADGEILVSVAGRSVTALAEREPRFVAALSHLAHRAAEALLDDDAAAQVEVRGVRRAPREEPRERSRDGRRDQRGRGDRPSRSRDPEDRDIDEAELERLARDAARAVRDSGEPELLPPMNSRERWFVHNALKDERGVRSESEGDGARKRVKIFPA